MVSLFQRVLPNPAVSAQLIEMIRNDSLPVHVVDAETLREAAAIYNPVGSKKNTLIDCSVVAIVRRIGADGVLAFDEFYVNQDLKLADELAGSVD